jgi:hypothetical protein
MTDRLPRLTIPGDDASADNYLPVMGCGRIKTRPGASSEGTALRDAGAEKFLESFPKEMDQKDVAERMARLARLTHNAIQPIALRVDVYAAVDLLQKAIPVICDKSFQKLALSHPSGIARKVHLPKVMQILFPKEEKPGTFGLRMAEQPGHRTGYFPVVEKIILVTLRKAFPVGSGSGNEGVLILRSGGRDLAFAKPNLVSMAKQGSGCLMASVPVWFPVPAFVSGEALWTEPEIPGRRNAAGHDTHGHVDAAPVGGALHPRNHLVNPMPWQEGAIERKEGTFPDQVIDCGEGADRELPSEAIQAVWQIYHCAGGGRFKKILHGGFNAQIAASSMVTGAGAIEHLVRI